MCLTISALFIQRLHLDQVAVNRHQYGYHLMEAHQRKIHVTIHLFQHPKVDLDHLLVEYREEKIYLNKILILLFKIFLVIPNIRAQLTLFGNLLVNLLLQGLRFGRCLRDALRDFISFAQFKKREKHPWRSLTFSKVTG